MGNKARVFVIMPFSDENFEVFEMLKDTFEDDFIFSNAAEEDNQQNILADIIRPIYESDIILADLTDLNPNVMYELGVAHSLNKKTIVITRDELSKLPFDLKQYRAKDYSTHFTKFNALIKYLDKNLKGAISGTVVFSNPVVDFLNQNDLSISNNYKPHNIETNIPDDEPGLIDFIADIESDMSEYTEHLNCISEEMQTMGSEIEKCTDEIDRVKNSGGTSVSFIRKQAKKAAQSIRTFSNHLKDHNNCISTLWDKIEKNTLGLLENKHSVSDDNKPSLIDFLKSLYGVKGLIINSKKSIIEMKKSSLNNMGLERNLNQAIRFLDEDLTAFINNMEQQISSIDSIMTKSRFVVGQIDFETEENENG